ncbi:MAG TPA: COX15/CtaA family protein [Patescibacteria group bacterium]|nr:COX15/CtaA family protein [Patescibacteria group bacterium]
MTAEQGREAARTPRPLHRFVVFTTACTFLLLIAGALVTSTGAGLSVPTWPFAPSGILPRMVGGVRFEYSHRMIAGFVGLLTLVMAAWAWRREPRRWLRWLAMGALILVVIQAVLGGVTVLFDLPAAISTAHAATAQIFFCTLVALVLFTGDWWQNDVPRMEEKARPMLCSVASATVAVIFVQLVLGAAFRHDAFGVLPHVFGAGVVTAMVAWTATIVFTRYADIAPLRQTAKFLVALLAVQLCLGVAAYWAVLYQNQLPQPYPLPVAITVAHVVNGALTLAAAVWLSLVAFRLFGPLGEWALAPASARHDRRAAPVRTS